MVFVVRVILHPLPCETEEKTVFFSLFESFCCLCDILLLLSLSSWGC